jgi:hypothetical protein
MFLNQDTWRILQIEIYLVLHGNLKIYRMKIRTRIAAFSVDFCGNIGHQFQPTSSQFSTGRHEGLTYYLVIKTRVRLRCDPYRILSLYVTVRNTHNRWQHTAKHETFSRGFNFVKQMRKNNKRQNFILKTNPHMPIFFKWKYNICYRSLTLEIIKFWQVKCISSTAFLQSHFNHR